MATGSGVVAEEGGGGAWVCDGDAASPPENVRTADNGPRHFAWGSSPLGSQTHPPIAPVREGRG